MNLLQMGSSASVLILCVMALRSVAIHRLPKTLFLVLWEVAALRLVLPFYIPAALSPLPFSRIGQRLALWIDGAPPHTTPYAPEPNIQTAFSPFVLLWAAGTLLLTVWFLLSYVRNIRRFRTSLPDRSTTIQAWLAEHPCLRPLEVRISDQITSPLTYGILCPVILLPKGLDRADCDTLQAVLIHEYVHVRRWDNLAKAVFTSALCLHWWNPLAWMMYMAANRDMELSCDATVLRVLGRDRRSAYALALISLEEGRGCYVPAQSYFSQNAITERIEAIMKFKKSSAVALVTSALLVVSCAAAAFASEDPARPSDGAPLEGDYIDLGGYSQVELEDGTTIYFPAGQDVEDADVSFHITDSIDAVTADGQKLQKADFSRVLDLTSQESLS